jgi:acetylornithine/succinyldiaminopimelate/putrescine aminotransferase
MDSFFTLISGEGQFEASQKSMENGGALTARQLFLNHLAQTTDAPLMLEIKSAEGLFLHGTDGKKYADLISGIGVSNVGHRNPEVVKAIRKQTSKYLHLMVYGEYVQLPQVKLARRLVNTLPAGIDNVYFVNSGSEAIEGAMKLAKRYTGRTELIACHGAYHGSTQGALTLNGDESFKNAYRPLLPDVRHINFGEITDLEQITCRTAAVFIETVQGEAGVRTASPAYFQALRQRCTDMGALLVVDEIQAGFGRTGTFWAFEQYGFVPDVVVAAKGMGGGMPIGAFMAPKTIMDCLKNNPILGHITTFGGHPVSCAASLATLRYIWQKQLHRKVAAKAELFKRLLVHPKIKEVRMAGLMIAVEFESFGVLKAVIDRAISYGVVTDWFLHCNTAMRIAPPLIISKDQIRDVCGIILKAINKATSTNPDVLLRERE